MGLDIYAGPVTRYVAGDWLTIVQQTGEASGMRVEVIRANQPADVIRDPVVVGEAVRGWQAGLLGSLGVDGTGWPERADGPYLTDKPDWDGYGAVVLLAAIAERPDLAPGAKVRHGLRSRRVAPTLPRAFAEAEVFKAASQQPQAFPTLLSGAEWCLPVTTGPSVFRAHTPNGTPLTMGRVDRLVDELHRLNQQTSRLGAADFGAARRAGPPRSGAPLEDVAPFGLAVLIPLAEFALANSAAWIMDY